jgi:hypothetical protein
VSVFPHYYFQLSLTVSPSCLSVFLFWLVPFIIAHDR